VIKSHFFYNKTLAIIIDNHIINTGLL
jgi:hypothetical protein